MPLRKARASRVEDGSNDGAVLEFSGTLRSPGDPDALSVIIGLRDSEITMHADGAQLGSWPAETVEVRRFGKTAFEFTAEGDRLIFTPDDSLAFGESPFVGRREVDADERDRRKERRKKKREKPAESKPTRHRGSRDKKRSGERKARQAAKKPRAWKPPRRHRTSDAELADEKSVTIDVAVSTKPDDPEPANTTSNDIAPQADTPPSDGRRAGESPEADDVPSTNLKARINATWIRTLDVARRYDAFGLDRVPIDTSLRGQEHQHTWDHRVAATSGLGQHICTICGTIRRKA